MAGKRIQCWSYTSLHILICLQPFLRYSDISVVSDWFSTVLLKWTSVFLPHFSFPWVCPWDNRDKCHTVGRGFNACKMPRCIYPSIFNHFWDIASYWSKIAILSYPPLFNAPAGCDPVGISWRCLMLVKLEWLGYRMLKNYDVKPFSYNISVSQTDGRTDRIAISISRISVLTRDKNAVIYVNLLAINFFMSW